MSTKPRTHIALLLDRSGSMAVIREDARGSYNAYLSEQQAESADEAFWSLTLFGGDMVERRHDSVPLAEMLPMEEREYVPQGNTPLYDAMGETMTALEGTVRDGDRVLFVVITDGHENASREWSHDAVESKVKELTDRGNWTIVYLASTPDAVQIGQDLGMARANAAYFERGSERHVMRQLSAATSRYRQSDRLASHSLGADVASQEEDESD